MFIQLNEDRAITSDANQFMLNKSKLRKKENSDGKEQYWEPYLYFGSMRLVLARVPEQLLKEINAKGWSECRDILNRATVVIENALTI